MRKLINTFITLFIFASATAGYIAWDFLTHPIGDPSVQILYELRPKTPFSIAAKELQVERIVAKPTLFYLYGKFFSGGSKIKAAEYKLSGKMLPSELLTTLTSGISFGHPLVIPEGYSLNQISYQFEKLRTGTAIEFSSLVKDPGFIRDMQIEFALPVEVVKVGTLEGYLYPETYSVSKKDTVKDIIKRMIQKNRSMATVVLANTPNQSTLSEHQLMTMASVVEKETGSSNERPLIASVFFNRLKKSMRLQSDPTVIYGIRDYDGNITRKDLERYTPYNTYRIPALPPGPICNPGKEAFQAVLRPAFSNYLYFVSHNDGTHEFTETYADHAKAVTRFQLDQKARQGKSWRDLNKKSAVDSNVKSAQ